MIKGRFLLASLRSLVGGSIGNLHGFRLLCHEQSDGVDLADSLLA